MANTISEKIKELLRKEKKTQKEISDYLGFSIMGFNRMLKADDYKFSTLLKIADFFNVSIDYFTSGATTSTKSKEVEKLELEIKELKERAVEKNFMLESYRLELYDSVYHTEMLLYEIFAVGEKYNINIKEHIKEHFTFKKTLRNILKYEREYKDLFEKQVEFGRKIYEDTKKEK